MPQPGPKAGATADDRGKEEVRAAVEHIRTRFTPEEIAGNEQLRFLLHIPLPDLTRTQLLRLEEEHLKYTTFRDDPQAVDEVLDLEGVGVGTCGDHRIGQGMHHVSLAGGDEVEQVRRRAAAHLHHLHVEAVLGEEAELAADIDVQVSGAIAGQSVLQHFQIRLSAGLAGQGGCHGQQGGSSQHPAQYLLSHLKLLPCLRFAPRPECRARQLVAICAP